LSVVSTVDTVVAVVVAVVVVVGGHVVVAVVAIAQYFPQWPMVVAVVVEEAVEANAAVTVVVVVVQRCCPLRASQTALSLSDLHHRIHLHLQVQLSSVMMIHDAVSLLLDSRSSAVDESQNETVERHSQLESQTQLD
jgi:hypothetical protein